MVNIVGDKPDGGVCKCKLHSTRVIAAKTPHIPKTSSRRNTRGIILPIKIDANPRNSPVARGNKSGAVAIDRRRLTDQERVARTIRNFTYLHAAAMVRESPQNAKAIDGEVTIHFLTR